MALQSVTAQTTFFAFDVANLYLEVKYYYSRIEQGASRNEQLLARAAIINRLILLGLPVIVGLGMLTGKNNRFFESVKRIEVLYLGMHIPLQFINHALQCDGTFYGKLRVILKGVLAPALAVDRTEMQLSALRHPELIVSSEHQSERLHTLQLGVETVGGILSLYR